jgi:hypothetical protein
MLMCVLPVDALSSMPFQGGLRGRFARPVVRQPVLLLLQPQCANARQSLCWAQNTSLSTKIRLKKTIGKRRRQSAGRNRREERGSLKKYSGPTTTPPCIKPKTQEPRPRPLRIDSARHPPGHQKKLFPLQRALLSPRYPPQQEISYLTK